MNLESAMEQDYPIGAPGEQAVDQESLFAPANLVQVNDAIEAVVRLDGERSSPVLLGWAFILSKVTTSLLERGVPEAYHAFAEQSLRVDVAPSSSSSSSARSSQQRSAPQPLFQVYAAHALSPSAALFPVLATILHSSLLGSDAATTTTNSAAAGTSDPNAVGYLSVLRGLVTSFPNLIRLSFLSPAQLEALYDVFAALYGNRSAALLCAQFWEDQAVVASAAAATSSSDDPADLEANLLLLNRTVQSSGEAEIVEIARSRFPVQFGGLVKLVRALCVGVSGLLPPDHVLGGDAAANNSNNSESTTSSDDELLAAKCAQTIFAYLATLPTLTHVVPSGPGMTPLPYEVAAYPDPDTGYAFRVIRPIGVSRSVAIPTGTQGRLVSANGSKPVVVAWDFEWSAWRLFADVLEDFAGLGRTGSSSSTKRVRAADVFGSKEAVTDALPMEWDSEEEQERDVTAVIEILRVTLRTDHALAPVLVDHLATAPGHASGDAGTSSAPRYDLVEVLFRILERSLAPNSNRPASSTALVSSLIGLIAALLPSFPGVVWTFLRGSTLLFPSHRVTTAYGGGGRSAVSFAAAASSPLLQAEKLSGQYPVTLALLSLVRALVLEDQIAACVSSPEYRDVKRGVLVRALKWVRDDVWPVFGSWRFATLADKYALARSCVQLYSLVLEYAQVGAPTAEAAAKANDPVVQVVVDSFLGAKATVAQLAPALSTLSSGPDGIMLLRKAGRYADAQTLEDLVDSTLGLVLELLRLRRRTKGASMSLLEKLCLTPSAGATSYSKSASPSTFGFTAVLHGQEPTRRPELLESLLKFVVAPLDTRLAVQAAQIVTLLCLVSAGTDDGTTAAAAVRSPISLATLLGGSDGIETSVKALLSVAEDHLAAPELQVAVWDLVSHMVLITCPRTELILDAAGADLLPRGFSARARHASRHWPSVSLLDRDRHRAVTHGRQGQGQGAHAGREECAGTRQIPCAETPATFAANCRRSRSRDRRDVVGRVGEAAGRPRGRFEVLRLRVAAPRRLRIGLGRLAQQGADVGRLCQDRVREHGSGTGCRRRRRGALPPHHSSRARCSHRCPRCPSRRFEAKAGRRCQRQGLLRGFGRREANHVDSVLDHRHLLCAGIAQWDV